ncbi:hypothetical protein D3C87_1774370 [compost metagenome]
MIPFAIGFGKEIIGPAFGFIRRFMAIISKTCLHVEEWQSNGCKQRYSQQDSH